MDDDVRQHADRDRDGPVGRVALFGPARTRVGTGPFLARWCDRAGLAVVACAGRDLERTRAAAAELMQWRAEQGIASDPPATVAAFDSLPRMLTEATADVLVVATPPSTHREALRAALASGDVRAVLCEKPLVQPDEMGDVAALLDGFVHADCLLVENCQWPETLHVFDRLHPGVRDGAPRRIAMGLAPVGRGLDMILDSLSHVLSVVQALVAVDASTRLEDLTFATKADDAVEQQLEFTLVEPFAPVRVRLSLRRSQTQPRPAWIAIDGRRVDRRVSMAGGGYRIGFVAGEGEEPDPSMPVAFEGETAEGRHVERVDDPLGALVYRFADSVRRSPDPELVRVESERIRQRCRLYALILEAW